MKKGDKMAVKKKVQKKVPAKRRCNIRICNPHKCGALYGLGFLGAVVYYIATATSFLGGVLGVLKALVWPAFLVFQLMKFLGM